MMSVVQDLEVSDQTLYCTYLGKQQKKKKKKEEKTQRTDVYRVWEHLLINQNEKIFKKLNGN